MNTAINVLRRNVSGAIERGEATAVAAIEAIKPATVGQWQVWSVQNGVALHDQTGSLQLQYFKDKDALINWLYASGWKDDARKIHAMNG